MVEPLGVIGLKLSSKVSLLGLCRGAPRASQGGRRPDDAGTHPAGCSVRSLPEAGRDGHYLRATSASGHTSARRQSVRTRSSRWYDHAEGWQVPIDAPTSQRVRTRGLHACAPTPTSPPCTAPVADLCCSQLLSRCLSVEVGRWPRWQLLAGRLACWLPLEGVRIYIHTAVNLYAMLQAWSTAHSAVLCGGTVSLSTPILYYEKGYRDD